MWSVFFCSFFRFVKSQNIYPFFPNWSPKIVVLIVFETDWIKINNDILKTIITSVRYTILICFKAIKYFLPNQKKGLVDVLRIFASQLCKKKKNWKEFLFLAKIFYWSYTNTVYWETIILHTIFLDFSQRNKSMKIFVFHAPEKYKFVVCNLWLLYKNEYFDFIIF